MNNLQASVEILKLVISKEEFDNLTVIEKKSKLLELFQEIYKEVSSMASENKPEDPESQGYLELKLDEALDISEISSGEAAKNYIGEANLDLPEPLFGNPGGGGEGPPRPRYAVRFKSIQMEPSGNSGGGGRKGYVIKANLSMRRSPPGNPSGGGKG